MRQSAQSLSSAHDLQNPYMTLQEATMPTANTTLGELISLFYDEYLTLYGDKDLASVAAAASVNELLIEEALQAQRASPQPAEVAA